MGGASGHRAPGPAPDQAITHQPVLPELRKIASPWIPVLAVFCSLAHADGKGRTVRKLGGIGQYRGRTEFPCLLCGYTIKKRDIRHHLEVECRQYQKQQRERLERERPSPIL